MSLTDGRSKMSKSDPNEGSRITLLDPPEMITKKIKRAKTDPQSAGWNLAIPNVRKPDNLLGLYAILSGKGREAAATECADMGWGKFKPLLAEATVAALEPIQARHRELMEDPAELDQVLAQGRDKAETVAERNPGSGASTPLASTPALISSPQMISGLIIHGGAPSTRLNRKGGFDPTAFTADSRLAGLATTFDLLTHKYLEASTPTTQQSRKRVVVQQLDRLLRCCVPSKGFHSSQRRRVLTALAAVGVLMS